MSPRVRPLTVAQADTTRPTTREIWPPYRVRLKMSRPNMSVPNQCSADGGCILLSGLISSGSTPVSDRAKTAEAITSRMMRAPRQNVRSEEHTSELQSLMRISYAVFCLKKKIKKHRPTRYKSQHKTTQQLV